MSEAMRAGSRSAAFIGRDHLFGERLSFGQQTARISPRPQRLRVCRMAAEFRPVAPGAAAVSVNVDEHRRGPIPAQLEIEQQFGDFELNLSASTALGGEQGLHQRIVAFELGDRAEAGRALAVGGGLPPTAGSCAVSERGRPERPREGAKAGRDERFMASVSGCRIGGVRQRASFLSQWAACLATSGRPWCCRSSEAPRRHAGRPRQSAHAASSTGGRGELRLARDRPSGNALAPRVFTNLPTISWPVRCGTPCLMRNSISVVASRCPRSSRGSAIDVAVQFALRPRAARPVRGHIRTVSNESNSGSFVFLQVAVVGQRQAL